MSIKRSGAKTMASMSPRRRVGPKGASSKHVLEKGRSQTCPSKGIGPKHVPRNFRIVFVVSRLGFDLGARKNVKLRQKQIQIKDTGTSSSRKLRRAIYYTLYRMDPQKNAQDLRTASLIYIHNPIPIRTVLMRCIDFITCSNLQVDSLPHPRSRLSALALAALALRCEASVLRR